MVLKQGNFSPILWRGELRDAWEECPGWDMLNPSLQHCPSLAALPRVPQNTLLTFSSTLGCGGFSVIRVPKSHRAITRSSVASRASRVTFLVPRVFRMGGSLRSSQDFFFFFCLSLRAGPCRAPAQDKPQWGVGDPLSDSKKPQPSPLPTTATKPRCITAAAFLPQQGGTWWEVWDGRKVLTH